MKAKPIPLKGLVFTVLEIESLAWVSINSSDGIDVRGTKRSVAGSAWCISKKIKIDRIPVL